MNVAKKCAKCEKTVYPTEQLNCLDKCWHKMCFKCQTCNMTLNMKNYKGYDKLPYCNAHYPTTKHTAVAETPEMMRIATNTRNQSLVEYHKDFEQTKDQIHQVADTLEMKRVKDNTKNISQREYHKEFQETKEKIHQVPDTLEMKRVIKNTKNISVREYHKDFQQSKEHIHQTADTLEMKRVKDNTKNISARQYHSEFEKSKGTYSQIPDSVEMKSHERNTKNYSLIKYHEDFEKHKGMKISVADDPETVRVKKNMETVSNVMYHNELKKKQNMEMMRPQEYDAVNVRRRQPGSISDYDPSDTSQSYNTNTGTPYSAKHQSTKVYDSRTGADPNYNVRHYSSGSASSMENGSSQRKVGSISDYDPMNERYGSLTGQYSAESRQPEYRHRSSYKGGSVQGDPPQPPVFATQDDSGVVADDESVKEDKLPPKPLILESPVSPQINNEAPPVLQSEVLPLNAEDNKQPPLPESEVPPLELEDDQPLPQSEVPPLELEDDQPPPVPQSEVPPLETEDDQPPPVPQSEVPQLSQQEDTVLQKEVSSLETDTDTSEGVCEPEIHGGHPQQYHQPPPQQYNHPPQQYQPQPQQYSPQPQQYQPQPQPPRARPESSGPMYKAMYDYTAADIDEVSFMEGDIIINTHIIDDGWMDGTVKRTGGTGMLPSNYVERV